MKNFLNKNEHFLQKEEKDVEFSTLWQNSKEDEDVLIYNESFDNI